MFSLLTSVRLSGRLIWRLWEVGALPGRRACYWGTPSFLKSWKTWANSSLVGSFVYVCVSVCAFVWKCVVLVLVEFVCVCVRGFNDELYSMRVSNQIVSLEHITSSTLEMCEVEKACREHLWGVGEWRGGDPAKECTAFGQRIFLDN